MAVRIQIAELSIKLETITTIPLTFESVVIAFITLIVAKFFCFEVKLTLRVFFIELNTILSVPATCFTVMFLVIVTFPISQKFGFIDLAVREAVVKVTVPSVPATFENIKFVGNVTIG